MYAGWPLPKKLALTGAPSARPAKVPVMASLPSFSRMRYLSPGCGLAGMMIPGLPPFLPESHESLALTK